MMIPRTSSTRPAEKKRLTPCNITLYDHPMPIPDLSTLQIAVLVVIGGTARPGGHLRERIEEEGLPKKTWAAFYQLMSRMEDAGLVEGEYRDAKVDGHTVKERWYRLTKAGIEAYNNSRRFFGSAPAL